MQTYESLDLSQNEAAEIDNLIWYFSELFKNELKNSNGDQSSAVVLEVV